MASLNRETINLKAGPASTLRNERTSEPLVFVHGGVPGSSPYCSGSHIWGPVLEQFAKKRGVLVVDLPGCGGTSSPWSTPTVDGYVDWMEALFTAAEIRRCFVIGHDLGGLIALELATRLPRIVRGVSVVSSVVSGPTGDGVENLVLAYPPVPLWTRHSQRWAFEQLSYSPHHITEGLLDACVDAAQQAPHLSAVAMMRDGGLEAVFTPGLMKAKGRFYELCREKGVPAPVQVIWGSHDRLGSLDQSLWLYKLVAARQTASHFHVINRVASFPFREDPAAFHQIVDSFCEAVFREAP
jgi:pimeloyl-ACP methyl ester carboxylesterase